MVKWDCSGKWATVIDWLVSMSVWSINSIYQKCLLCVSEGSRTWLLLLSGLGSGLFLGLELQSFFSGCTGLFWSHVRQGFDLHLFRFLCYFLGLSFNISKENTQRSDRSNLPWKSKSILSNWNFMCCSSELPHIVNKTEKKMWTTDGSQWDYVMTTKMRTLRYSLPLK